MNNKLSHGVTRLENAIVTLSGPALATSGIIAGVDILTNNLIARYAPGAGAIAGLIWAICLMLTLDFQVLMLGVRARRVYAARATAKSGKQKLGELVLCVLIAAALGYVSLQMGSIFAHMLGTTLTMSQAQADLGINPIALVYERSALVLLLIFLSGWLREHDSQSAPNNETTPAPVAPAPAPPPLDWKDMLHEFAKLQQSTIETVIERTMERVTITTIREQRPPDTLQIAAPGARVENDQPIYQGKFESKEQAIAAVLARKPGATVEEVAQEAECSPRTAAKWIQKLQQAPGA